ncbi:hypothetical protein [Variovorax sp. RA8]|uniref:hypothetical protein n=1 Tax=Variovorax sp. (strain JCM 16519 / RA8) TaxID=662548 RepID=UPI000A4AA1DE|nr:hypothetical protein [Variovorax sp. RA8]VTU44391.1 hypothetical protein RA8P2_00145 [Variovorax sp. RA8]
MARAECLRRWRARFGVALFLCLALLGAGARASMPVMQQAGPQAISIIASESMPMASDRMPCARCYVAPAPASHGFSGECREHEAPIWRVHAPSMLDAENFDMGGQLVRLPVRILYCRWLD